MNDLESAEKISIDIKKLERNLKQVEDINFEGKEKEVYDRAVDYMNDSKYYLEKKKDMRTAFGCIEYMRGNTSALIVCLGEVILSASLLYSNIFSLYIVKRSVCSFWLTFGIKLAMVVSFMMAVQTDKTAGTESVNVIIVLLILVSSVILILVCRIKYQDKMFSSMADYEYIKKI